MLEKLSSGSRLAINMVYHVYTVLFVIFARRRNYAMTRVTSEVYSGTEKLFSVKLIHRYGPTAIVNATR